MPRHASMRQFTNDEEREEYYDELWGWNQTNTIHSMDDVLEVLKYETELRKGSEYIDKVQAHLAKEEIPPEKYDNNI